MARTRSHSVAVVAIPAAGTARDHVAAASTRHRVQIPSFGCARQAARLRRETSATTSTDPSQSRCAHSAEVPTSGALEQSDAARERFLVEAATDLHGGRSGGRSSAIVVDEIVGKVGVAPSLHVATTRESNRREPAFRDRCLPQRPRPTGHEARVPAADTRRMRSDAGGDRCPRCRTAGPSLARVRG